MKSQCLEEIQFDSSGCAGWEFEVVESISAKHIEEIYQRNKCGIRIKNYCSPKVADQIAQGLVNDKSRTTYKVRWATQEDNKKSIEDFQAKASQDSDVDRVGPVSSIIGSYDSAAAISEESLRFIRKVRGYCHPEMSPVDRLRLEMDETLPGGAQIMNYPDNGKAFVGVGRVMDASKEMLHADTARAGCLTCNLYLQLPKTGGGTRVWRYSGEYENAPGSYLFGENEIPDSAPSALLEPTAGEMVIWNPLNPHMVLPFEGSPRISIQIWLKIEGRLEDRSLKVSFLN